MWTLHPLTRRRLRNRKNNKKARKTKNKSGIFIITSQGRRNGVAPLFLGLTIIWRPTMSIQRVFPFKLLERKEKKSWVYLYFFILVPLWLFTPNWRSHVTFFFLLIVKYKFAISSPYAYLKTNSLVLSYFQMNLHFCLSRSCCNYYVCQIDFLNKYVQ